MQKKGETVALWRIEARETLRVAKLAHNDKVYWLSLFHCHLAVEKALKAQYLEENGTEPPRMHELLSLAKKLQRRWTEGDITLFDVLEEFAVEARYHDQEWREKQATREHSEYWLEKTRSVISQLCP